MPKIFPSIILKFDADVYKQKYGQKNRALYNALIISLISLAVAMFFIKLPVTVQSSGIIKAQAEKTPVYASASGKIVFIKMKENLSIKQGDTLLMIENEVLQRQYQTQQIKQSDYQKLINDANYLCNQKDIINIPLQSLHTTLYKQNLLALQEQYHQTHNRYELLQKRFTRLSLLKEDKLIPAQEYEITEQELKQIEKDLTLSIEKAKNQWQQEMLNYQAQLREAVGNQQQLQQQMVQYVLRAPISGTLHNYTGVLKNTFVSAGQNIAEISPESEKMIECFVTPNNIGMIKKDMPVSFQIESFNYNQWSFLTGKVLDISNDVTMQQNIF